MIIYWIACGMSMAFLWISLRAKHSKNNALYWPIATFFSAFPLMWIASIRKNVGADYIAYYNYYNHILHGGKQGRFEILYYLLNKTLALLGMSAPWMFAFCAMLFLMPLFKRIATDSPYPCFSVFLLVASGYYFFFLNGMRQMIGAAIFTLAIPYIEKRKLAPFVLVVLIATGFHTMSIVFLGAYFLTELELDRKTTLCVTVLLIIASNPMANLFNKIIGGMDYYSLYLGSSYDNRGPGTISLIMAGAIVVFASVFYQKENQKYKLYYNLQLITFWVTIMTGKVVLIERFRMSFGLPSIIFIPLIVKEIKNAKIKGICTFLIVTLYFIYATYTIGVLNGNSVLPYETVFD